MFDSILYGVQGTAMPPWIDYGLTPESVGDLVNFIHSINIHSISPKPSKAVSDKQTADKKTAVNQESIRSQYGRTSGAERTAVNAQDSAAPVHTDTTAKWFLLSSISYFFIVGIIAVTIAAKFCWPELLGRFPISPMGGCAGCM